jgi:hypothetical protein
MSDPSKYVTQFQIKTFGDKVAFDYLRIDLPTFIGAIKAFLQTQRSIEF